MLARRSIRKQPNKQGKKARINLQMCRVADRQAELTRWLAVLIRHPWCRVLYRKCGGDDVDQEVKESGGRDGNFELKNRCRIREYDGKELQDIKVTGKARPDRRRKERMARWSGVWGENEISRQQQKRSGLTSKSVNASHRAGQAVAEQ